MGKKLDILALEILHASLIRDSCECFVRDAHTERYSRNDSKPTQCYQAVATTDPCITVR